MGDTGSLPLGGLIGVAGLATRQELLLLIVGGIFVVLWIVALRLGGRIDRERAEYDAAHPGAVGP